MRIFADADYRFLGYRRIAWVISIAVLVTGLLGGILWHVQEGSWLNYGIDFTGGTLVQVRFDEPVSIADMRETVTAVVPGTVITEFGGANEYLLRGPLPDEEGTEIADALVGLLSEAYPAHEVVRVEMVGPKIGDELRQRALIAILLSFVLTLIYLAFRFEWRFGIAAIVATAHDIALALGVISFFQLDVSLPTVAAVLTIIGYSLNDTIVVFDRVRENLKKLGRRESYEHILNRSINEVLPRTVITSGTTLGALFALLFLGGVMLREFAVILIVGIVVGTYSSIFIASPVLLEIQKRWAAKDKPTKDKDRTPRAGQPARARAAS